MKTIFNFLKEARAELKRVNWPTWNDVTRSTVVVFVSIILFTIFIYLVDNGISFVIGKVLG